MGVIHVLSTTSAAGKYEVLLRSLSWPGQNLITSNTEQAGTLQVPCSRYLFLKMRKLIKQAFTEHLLEARGYDSSRCQRCEPDTAPCGIYKWIRGRVIKGKALQYNYNSEDGQVWKFPEELT